MLGRLNVGGGSKINGLIEEYVVASDGNVNAGDFVKFVNDGKDTRLGTQTINNVYSELSAVALSPNKVFIAYGYTSSSYLYGIVCTIEGTTVTAGTDIRIGKSSYSEYIEVVALSLDKVFIVHSYGSDYQLYGIVCTIDGTTITAGTDKQISYMTGSGKYASVTTLSSNKVFISHRYSDNTTRLYGIVCTVEGTTITFGTDTQLSNGSSTGYMTSTVTLSPNKVFIVGYPLLAIVCTIDETTITAGTAISFGGGRSSGANKAVALSSNKVFIVGGNTEKVYGIVCTIEETTITFGTDTQIVGGASVARFNISTIMVSPNEIFIVYRLDGDTYLHGVVCTIEGMEIIAGIDKQITSEINTSQISQAVTLFQDKIFIVHNYSSSYFLYGIVHIPYEVITAVETSKDTIIGIAKTKGTSGQTVKVVVPNFEESEMN